MRALAWLKNSCRSFELRCAIFLTCAVSARAPNATRAATTFMLPGNRRAFSRFAVSSDETAYPTRSPANP